ncbi:odorant receptor 46a-like [Anopheles cruzii]|uniref:odorant receptor 46a-like n=1 Tax=Anopheles cruzii TaxID=68878 RepID=UPI0022EC782A|nr:odorant receptor 46a-like [Anopheles cruzii]
MSMAAFFLFVSFYDLLVVFRNDLFGYELNFLYQVSCILWTPPGLTASQNMFFSLIVNICVQYDLLLIQLADLDELIRNKASDRIIRQKLRHIICRQQHLERFINGIERVFSNMAFVEVFFLTLQIVLMLFVMRSNFWPPGVLLLPVCILQLFVLCLPGTLIEMKADQLTATIYSIEWYEMSVSNKRMFQMLLQHSQHPLILTCAGLMTIDMKLFMSVVKKVYSLFMMLENM